MCGVKLVFLSDCALLLVLIVECVNTGLLKERLLTHYYHCHLFITFALYICSSECCPAKEWTIMS